MEENREESMRKISGGTSEVLDLLTKIVSEQGEDFIYQPLPGTDGQCQYVHGDQPRCLVGHVLFRLGVPLDALRELDDGTGANIGVVDLAWALNLDMPAEAQNALSAAQDRQDGGETWGVALQAARDVLTPFLEYSN
jgi:hypothetical protein